MTVAMPSESKAIAHGIAALVDRYLLDAADADQRAAITNLAGLLRHATAFCAALTREIDHYAAEAADALGERDVLRAALADVRVDQQSRAREICVAAEDSDDLVPAGLETAGAGPVGVSAIPGAPPAGHPDSAVSAADSSAAGSPDSPRIPRPAAEHLGRTAELAELIAEELVAYFDGDSVSFFLTHTLIADVSNAVAERIVKATPPAPFTFGDLADAARVVEAHASMSYSAEYKAMMLALANRLFDASEADPNP